MSDGYDDPSGHDTHDHYDDSQQDDGQSIHAHLHEDSSTTTAYSHDSDSHLERDEGGYLDEVDSDRHVVVVTETLEVHDLETVETEHDGQLELVEYDNVHVEHVEHVVEVDDFDGRAVHVEGGN